ncbi:MAG: RNA polymerase sigma factor [Pseudomonadales bacterium]
MTQTMTDERETVIQAIRELPHAMTAYTHLVQLYEKQIYSLCLRYLSKPDLAQEASQEVFVKLFHALPKFEFRSSFKTWLYSIAINHCKTQLAVIKRDQARYQRYEELDPEHFQSSAGDTASCVAQEDDKVCVHEVIKQLKPQDRDLILLRFNSEFSLQEIADVVERKLSGTKMAFYRALDKFKRLYEEICL